MPFLPLPPVPHYLVYVGKCVTMPTYPDRYVAITIAGTFSLEEANNFILEVLDGPLCSYLEFFRDQVHVRTMFFFAEVTSPVLKKISFYLAHFTTIDYISQYEWQIARYDLDSKICEFIPPDTETAPLISGYLVDCPRPRPLY